MFKLVNIDIEYTEVNDSHVKHGASLQLYHSNVLQWPPGKLIIALEEREGGNISCK